MKKRGIVIEDEDGVREFLEYLLKESGYEVNAYRTATEFLSEQETLSTDADFIITDNYMPQMKGLDLIESLKNRRPSLVRNVAVISGSWTEDDLKRANRLGCKTISKPFGMAEILNWLESFNKDNISPFFDTPGYIA